jgi:GNAT superfamily N-acetyltransferase
MSYLTEPLNALHHKKQFRCGKQILDHYLHTQAKQDVKRYISACFVLADEANNVKGYYTLSSASLERVHLPEEIIRKLPPTYSNLPATLLGRLAVDNLHKGQGLGALLLMDALRRSYDVSIGDVASMAVVVDPLDEDARMFYDRYGFILLPDSGKMFLPMKTIADLFTIL